MMTPLAGFLGLGGSELMFLAVILVVLVFGARRIPDIGRGLGEGIRSFKSSLKGDTPSDEGKSGGSKPASS